MIIFQINNLHEIKIKVLKHNTILHKYILILRQAQANKSIMVLIDDLNYLIRYFSANISTAIDNIDKNEQQSSPPISFETQTIIDRYQNYEIDSQTELQMVRKMGFRILQIFSFLKMQNKHQSILSHLQRQLKNKFKIMMSVSPISLHKIFSYVVMISHRRISSIYRHNLSSVPHHPRESKQRKRVWSRTGVKQLNIRFDNNGFQYRKANSVTSSKNEKRKNKQESLEAIISIYDCMSIERNHLVKCIENNQHIEKQQLKRNSSTSKRIKEGYNRRQRTTHSSRKVKTDISFDENIKILGEVKSFNRMGQNLVDPKKGAVVAPWKFKKKRMPTAMKRKTINQEQESSSKKFLKNKENSFNF